MEKGRSGIRLLLAAVGVFLTACAIAGDHFGLFKPLEDFFKDKRALYCQKFTPAPDDKFVHVDIDDRALAKDSVGRWPWPRARLALLINEIAAAKPKVIAADLLFSEPEEDNSSVAPTGRISRGDELLASAVKDAGNVILASTLRFEDDLTDTPLARQLGPLLLADPELTQAECQSRILGPSPAPRKLAEFQEQFQRIRAAAVSRAVSNLLAKNQVPLDELQKRLLPRHYASSTSESTDLSKLVSDAYQQADESINFSNRFGTKPDSATALPIRLRAFDGQTPIPNIAAGARACGIADYLPYAGGTVRSVPLAADYRGRSLYQLGLLSACQYLDVPPDKIRLSPDKITIPRDARGDIEIPLGAFHSSHYGDIGCLFDIPWIGKGDWKTMYDPPHYEIARKHVSAADIWRLAREAEHYRNPSGDIVRLLQDAEVDYGPDQPAAGGSAESRARQVLLKLDEYLANRKSNPPLDDQGKQYDRKIKNWADLLRTFLLNHADFERDRKAIHEKIAGKAVFLGFTATGAKDAFPTSIHDDLCPGVVIHGVIFNAIMTQSFLVRAPQWLNHLVTALIGLAATVLVVRFSPFRAMIAASLLVIGYIAINGFVLFDLSNYVVGMAGPVMAGILVWSALTLLQAMIELRERQRVVRSFRSYLDPAFVDFLLQTKDRKFLTGQRRELTVVFTDLANFTSLSEKLGERALEIIREYLAVMVPVIRKHGGLINKFLGDGIMFFFGAPAENPNHAADAMVTIRAMQAAMGPVNQSLEKRGLPAISMRAGIGTGTMVVGDAGPPEAQDYTVLGDIVNLAARLEGANKFFGTSHLVTARTAELAADQFLFRPVCRLRVAGRKQSVTVCEAICRADDADDRQRKIVELTRAVVDAYVAGKFKECLTALDELERTAGVSRLTELYRSLATKFAANPPPPDFDGVIELESK